MKITPIIIAAGVSLAMAMPVAAHDNCNSQLGVCPEEVRDEEGEHADAIVRLEDMRNEADTDIGTNTGESMDPADSVGGFETNPSDVGAGSLNQGQL